MQVQVVPESDETGQWREVRVPVVHDDPHVVALRPRGGRRGTCGEAAPIPAALDGHRHLGLIEEPRRLANATLDRRGIRIDRRETRTFTSGMRGAVPGVEPET